MLQRTVVFALTLFAACLWFSPDAATAPPTHGQSPWLKAESQHFEIHFLIEGRWGSSGLRRFINALIAPRLDKTYDAVFELTPAEFDAAFRQYAEGRFRPVVR